MITYTSPLPPSPIHTHILWLPWGSVTAADCSVGGIGLTEFKELGCHLGSICILNFTHTHLGTVHTWH